MSSPVGNPVPGYSMGAADPNYAVPTEGTDGPGYHDSPVGAYATRLDSLPGTTPDPMRTQHMPARDYRPDPRFAPDNFWTGLRGPGRDYMGRHSVEFLDADGIEARLPTAAAQARNPREIPPPEPRWTNRLSPHNYVFTRPFAQDTERYFNGSHFSMADHRRLYGIMGMNPPPYRRNTYRADPVPWDSNIVDTPNPQPSQSPGRIIAYDLPPMSNSSWRL
jgi:hypothetical protein